MKKYSFFLVYTIGFLLSYASIITYENRVIFTGSMQFPPEIKKVPDVRVYWAGNRIECFINKVTKTISFDIPGLRQQRGIYLVIAEDVRRQFNAQGIVCYQYLTNTTPYKFYYLEREEQYNPATKKSKLVWNSKELQLLLDDNGNFRLPDEAIIIYYYANFIAGITNGKCLELPIIKVVPNIISMLGSESLFHDMSNALLCSALTMDAFHRELDKEIRPSHDQKTIITITT